MGVCARCPKLGVVGSSPIPRSVEGPAQAAFHPSQPLHDLKHVVEQRGVVDPRQSERNRTASGPAVDDAGEKALAPRRNGSAGAVLDNVGTAQPVRFWTTYAATAAISSSESSSAYAGMAPLPFRTCASTAGVVFVDVSRFGPTVPVEPAALKV